jgi:hypothetical protein
MGQPLGMSDIETLERHLVNDLRTVADRLDDERTARDLYRALTARALKPHEDDGHLALSRKRAEDLLSAAGFQNADGLADSGGEGEVSDRARELLDGIGWTSDPENTSRNDPMHDSSPKDPPPASRPPSEPPEWEQTAHEEAEQNRLRHS